MASATQKINLQSSDQVEQLIKALQDLQQDSSDYSSRVEEIIGRFTQMCDAQGKVVAQELAKIDPSSLTPIAFKKLARHLDSSHIHPFDISYLKTRVIGLLHFNRQEGFQEGQSPINLSFLPSEHWPRGTKIPQEKEFNGEYSHYVRLPAELEDRSLDPAFKTKRLQAYELSIRRCINDCLLHDIAPIELGQTKVGEVCEYVEKYTAFSLVDYTRPNRDGTASPLCRSTDIPTRHGLGRLPGEYVRPETIKDSLPSFTIQSIGEDPNRVIETREEGNALYEKIVNWHMEKLLNRLRDAHPSFREIGPINLLDYGLRA